MTTTVKNAIRPHLYLTGHLFRSASSRRWKSPLLLSSAIFIGAMLFSISSSQCYAQSEEDYYGMDDEMMEEMEMYNDGGYSGGGGGSRRGMSTQDRMADRLSQALASALKSTNLASLTDPESAPPVLAGPVLMNDATVAYVNGDFPLAMKLYFGHIVAEFDSAGSQMQMVKYSALMKRPTWNLRWGISYTMRGDATDPMPIGEVSARARGTGGPGGPGGMDEMGYDGMDDYEDDMRGPGGRGGMSEDEMMGYEGMDEEYEMEMEMEMGMRGGPMGARGRKEAPVAAPTPFARLSALERTMISEESAATLAESLGSVANVIGEGFDKRFSQGDFGTAMTDITAESGSSETVSEAFVEVMESSADPMPLWRPGIMFVGEGSSADNTVAARKAGIDLLIHIDVLLKPRGDWVQNICRCRLIHVPTGKSLGVSKPIDSLEFAQENRGKGTGSREFIDEKLENFFEIIDRQAVTTEMPSLTPEIAKRRIGTLLGAGSGKNLRTLAEVRLFQSQGLLTEEDVLTAFDIVGGEEAMLLIYGSEDERLRVVRKWAGGGSEEEIN